MDFLEPVVMLVLWGMEVMRVMALTVPLVPMEWTSRML
jgi:hypothetical protein